MKKKFTLQLPGTSANLGSGFDTFGLALTLYNRFSVSVGVRQHEIINIGEGASLLNNVNENLFFRAYALVCQKQSLEEIPLSVTANNAIPLSSGLGSSASAILGGIVAAYVVHDLPLDYVQILSDALDFENHLDNLGACLYGGFSISLPTEKGPMVSKHAIEYPLHCWIIYPHLTVCTLESRKALPLKVDIHDAIFNIAHAALFTDAMILGKTAHFAIAMQDRIHEDIRMNNHLLDYRILKEKLQGEEYYGGVVSGSGPSILLFCSEFSERLQTIIRTHFVERSISYTDYQLGIDNKGLQIF